MIANRTFILVKHSFCMLKKFAINDHFHWIFRAIVCAILYSRVIFNLEFLNDGAVLFISQTKMICLHVKIMKLTAQLAPGNPSTTFDISRGKGFVLSLRKPSNSLHNSTEGLHSHNICIKVWSYFLQIGQTGESTILHMQKGVRRQYTMNKSILEETQLRTPSSFIK